MRLAKPAIDIGLYTGAIERVEPFWRDEIGLTFDHILQLDHDGVAWEQHRYRVGHSIIKLNARPVNPAPPGGYRALLIAREGLTTPRELCDPDGNRVVLVPPGHRGISQIGVEIGARDLARTGAFYRALGCAPVAEGAYKIGESMILIEPDAAVAIDQPLFAPGWRYLTLQIFDAHVEHARFLAAGGREGIPVSQLRDVVRAAMPRDPDGNWFELSQRASLVGPISG